MAWQTMADRTCRWLGVWTVPSGSGMGMSPEASGDLLSDRLMSFAVLNPRLFHG